jgi:tetratricopeptide (TPR) repeat protein
MKSQLINLLLLKKALGWRKSKWMPSLQLFMQSKIFQKSIFAFLLLALFSASIFAQKGANAAAQSYQKGIALAKKNDFYGAIQEFQKATKANPKYYEAFVALGLSQQQVQDFSSAAETFKTAISLRPKLTEPLMLLGALFQQQNDANGALSEYREAVKLAPNDAEAHSAIGFVLAATNQFPEAIKEFETAIKLKPTLAQAHYFLGTAKLFFGRSGRRDRRACASCKADADEYRRALLSRACLHQSRRCASRNLIAQASGQACAANGRSATSDGTGISGRRRFRRRNRSFPRGRQNKTGFYRRL